MKKFASLLLALTMALALAVPAFAEDTVITKLPGSETKNVTADYKKESLTSTETVYHVTITWAAIEETTPLKYTGKQATYTWNGSTMQYTEDAGATEAKWEGAAGYKVTVTNRSNDAVWAKTSATNTYELDLTKPANETQKMNSAAVKDGVTINPAETEKVGTQQDVDFTYTYSATTGAKAVTVENSGSVTVGTISLSLSATEPTA